MKLRECDFSINIHEKNIYIRNIFKYTSQKKKKKKTALANYFKKGENAVTKKSVAGLNVLRFYLALF